MPEEAAPEHAAILAVNREAVLGVVFALVAAIGFSAKAIFVKLAYRDVSVDAITFLVLRMAFSVPFFIGVALWFRYRRAAPLSGHDRLLVLGLGLLGYYLSSLFDFMGLEYITAGLERLILFLYPTFTVILTALIYRRPIGRSMLAAMALCYIGIVLVFVHEAGVKQGGNLVLGASLVFAATLTYSSYLVGAGHAIARIGATRFTAYAMIVASAAAFVQFALTRHLAALEVPAHVYALSIGVALFSTVLPAFALGWAIRHIGSGSASLIGAIGPVSTIYMAYLFLGESLSLIQLFGSALVLGGVLIVSLNSRKA
jgi:drug/metabolite transporter (DMT)-like permease